MSSKSYQLDLLSLLPSDSCAEGATSSSSPDTVSEFWKKGKRLSAYSDAEIVGMVKESLERLNLANYQYSVCSRYKKSHWAKQERNWGSRWKRCNEEMARRNILYDPKGSFSRPTGKKGDHARKA